MSSWDEAPAVPRFRDLIDNVSDQEFCSGVHSMLCRREDELSPNHPGRIVLLAMTTDGIIGNGGFEFLFSWDYPNDPDYSRSLAAYETIGCDYKADAYRDALAVFPDSRPPADADERIDLYQRHPEEARDSLSTRFFGTDLDHGNTQFYTQVADFIRSHAEQFRLLDEPPRRPTEPLVRPPGGGVTILSLLLLFAGTYMAISSLREERPLLASFYMVPVIGSLLIWARQEWGKWLVVGYFGLAGGLTLLFMLTGGFSWRALLRCGFAAWLAWEFAQWTSREKMLATIIERVRERMDSLQRVRIAIPLDHRLSDADRTLIHQIRTEVKQALRNVGGLALASETGYEEIGLIIEVREFADMEEWVLPVLQSHFPDRPKLSLISTDGEVFARMYRLDLP